MSHWDISIRIAAWDKGNKVNEWYLEKFPDVVDAIDRYVNEFWRPKHERWSGKTSEGIQCLEDGAMFGYQRPEATIQKRLRLPVRSVGTILARILKRANIPKLRAHAHAFRKTVVTTLLRAGNPLKTVSVFVHHSSTNVTEKSYDKRSREELLDKMVLPIGWERLNADLGNAEQDAAKYEMGDAQSTITNTDDRDRIQCATALLAASETLSKLKEKNRLLKDLLSPHQLQQYEAMCNEIGLSVE
jgi:hypothetical protein